jgi:hypothetical protein
MKPEDKLKEKIMDSENFSKIMRLIKKYPVKEFNYIENSQLSYTTKETIQYSLSLFWN